MKNVDLKQYKNYAKTNILFLDNYLENKRDIINSLRFKFECIEAKNPKDLVFACHKYDVDYIIISDKNLDIIGETIKTIQASEIHNPIILVATEENSCETRVKCFEMGASDVIQKPYLPEELSHKIKGLQRLRNK